MDHVTEGYYDLFITNSLRRQLQGKHGCEYAEPLHKETFWHEFPSHVAAQIREYLSAKDEEIPDKKLYDEVRRILTDEDFIRHVAESIIPVDGRKLKAIIPSQDQLAVMPDTPLSSSALLTGAAHTPKLYEQIKKELLTCDRADWMVSFIRMSGLNPLMPALREFTTKHRNAAEPCLRIATTVYLGVTEPKAIKMLQELPNTEIRVSYDTKSTRLHAKSYIFHRATGFGSAYVGSSNVSKVAMDDGLEWNIKVSQREVKHLWDATIASFESHWEDAKTFVPCRGEQGIERLTIARNLERKCNSAPVAMTFFDLHPYPYQEEALEDIARERSAGKQKHLIIAATGTGKTMIAAFDYKNFIKEHPGATLLFLAHRKEILEQAMSSFRQVLKDGSFGCLVDKDNAPSNTTHWFCTMQSWLNQRERFAGDYFQYVVVDEAHHSAAQSYLEILSGLQSQSLLGLTATPERMDGQDIVSHFGGCFTHELRLGDAIERALLCPFVYYGVCDAEDINYTKLDWVGGKYKTSDIDRLLAHNEMRADWVLSQINMRVEDMLARKMLGFCSSVAHAQFMARYCNERGIPAIALSGESTLEERSNAKKLLERGEICIIFTVDLYNEGVDIPMIDTVVFLRPTESVTVFLQQLGRGLRRCEDKECLLVFDFIAPQNERFNYAQRFKALCGQVSTKAVQKMVESGFVYLPTGCSITLEKTAASIVLDNVKKSIGLLNKKRMVRELRNVLRTRGKKYLSLQELLDEFGLESPDELYNKALPHVLHKLAEDAEHDDTNDKKLQSGFLRVMQQTDASLLTDVQESLDAGAVVASDSLTSFYRVLWGDSRPAHTVEEVHQYVCSYEGLRRDLSELVQWTTTRHGLFKTQRFDKTGHLKLYGHYTREQVLLALGLSTFEKAYPSREGVLHVKNKNLYVFFADIDKNEDEFSPTTMYDDYAISESLFHWQSQSTTTPHSPTGQNFIHHQEREYTIMLFVRKRKNNAFGANVPYVFLGPVRYVSHEGARPMSIKWRMHHPIPAHVLSWAKREH